MQNKVVNGFNELWSLMKDSLPAKQQDGDFEDDTSSGISLMLF